MTTRILPSMEWEKLNGTELEAVWPYLDPALTTIVVVEDGEAIVGCHALIWMLHAECLWTKGGTGVKRALWRAVQEQAALMGAQRLITAATDDRVRSLLTHVGASQLPGDHYVVPMKKGVH